MTVWFYDDCYIRFAVEKYDDPQFTQNCDSKLNTEWINNKYRHLVNNSVGKKSKKFGKPFIVPETETTVDDHMWSLQQFKDVSPFLNYKR